MAIEDFVTMEGIPVNGYVCAGVPSETGYGFEVVYFDDPCPVRADWARRMWLRQWRDMRLVETDWLENSSVPMSTTEREAWKAYRQQLRDLPSCGCSISVEAPYPPSIDPNVDTKYSPWRDNTPPPKPDGWEPPRSASTSDVINQLIPGAYDHGDHDFTI